MIRAADPGALGYARASCVSGCFSLAAAARACSRKADPLPAEFGVVQSPRRPPPSERSPRSRAPAQLCDPSQEPTRYDRSHPHHHLRTGIYPAPLRDADPQVRPVRGGGHPRPHLARQPHHPGPALAVHRPAGRQPGADRPDVPGPQARDVRPAGADGLQGDRGRLPLLRRDRLRLRALHHRGGRDPRGRDDLRPDPGPRGADRAHRRVAARARRRATVHLYNATAPVFRRVVFRGSRDAGQADRGGRHPAGDGVRREDAGRRDDLRLPVQPGDLHRHRAGLRAGGLRGRHGRLAARGGPRDHPQPARHRGALDALHPRGPLRVDVAATCPGASTSACRSTRTTTAVPPSPPPSWR